MSELVYEASVYKRTVKYTNFKGETQSTELYFALDPLQLMQVIAGFKPTKAKKSGNPARREPEFEISDEEQLRFIRDLCERSAGWPSDDGESWEPFPNFSSTIAGKAFLTKLTSSDADRKEFAEKVIIDPFKAFVEYAASDPSNSKKEIQQFQTMAAQLETVFAAPAKDDESLEERRARLQAELEAMNGPSVES